MKNLVLGLALLSAAACGKPFTASVEAKEVCVKQLAQKIPGATTPPAATAATLPALAGVIDKTITISASDLDELTKNDVTATLGLQSFHLDVPPGTFDKLNNVKIVLQPKAGSGLLPVTLIDHTSGGVDDGLVHITSTSVSGDLSKLGTNLLDYLAAGDVQMQLHADGELPTTEFLANVEVCASARADYDYGKKIGL